MKFIKVINIPEVTQDEYIDQVKDVVKDLYDNEISNTEALDLLYTGIAIDDHLDTALEIE